MIVRRPEFNKFVSPEKCDAFKNFPEFNKIKTEIKKSTSHPYKIKNNDGMGR